MERSESVSDSAPKKLARQLDFTASRSRILADLFLTPQSRESEIGVQIGSQFPLYSCLDFRSQIQPSVHPARNPEQRVPISTIKVVYCECFASESYCDGCKCLNCHNSTESEALRQAAFEAILERNPKAFRPKIAIIPPQSSDCMEDSEEIQEEGKHNRGCHCKRSGCLKKDCECFQANILLLRKLQMHGLKEF